MKKIIKITAAVLLTITAVSCEKRQPEKADAVPAAVTEVDTQSIWPRNLGELPVDLADNMLNKNYYLIFDGSGSMDGSKLRTAKEALMAFISRIPEDANTGLLVFDSQGISERVSLSRNRELLKEEILAVDANHGTPLKHSISMAYDNLTLQGHRQQGYGEYHLVIVTDGEASDGQDPRDIVDEIIKESPIVIHTIGFKIGQNHSLNQPGRILYKSASNLDELKKGLEDVLAESEDFSVSSF